MPVLRNKLLWLLMFLLVAMLLQPLCKHKQGSARKAGVRYFGPTVFKP